MRRREFIGTTAAGSLVCRSASTAAGGAPAEGTAGLVVERSVAGSPHAGKVLLAIQPHADDIPLFAAGTVAKLLDEGYTGHLVRVTNDDMAGPGTIGRDGPGQREGQRPGGARPRAEAGLQPQLSTTTGWTTSRSPSCALRLIFLIRLLKVDTVVCYDPWGHYEENPDHYVTAQCVEAACWMAGGGMDYPEHFAAGLEPHAVREKYYFARGPQLVNRVVDIGATIDRKVEANLANLAQGPAGRAGERLRASLAERRLKLPALGDDDATANRQYVREFVLRANRELGRKHGLEYAEAFHYVGPNALALGYSREEMDEYVQRNAVPLDSR